jgi:putative PIN family toxin of toxin-antitoxin system
LKVVFDTNVLISALLLADSVPSIALQEAERRGTILYSLSTIKELSEVLSRPKLARYIDPNAAAGFLARIHRSWKEIEILHSVEVCRDSKDDKFLDLALNGDASVIVTGDEDLLTLNPYREIKIINPHTFLELLMNT